MQKNVREKSVHLKKKKTMFFESIKGENKNENGSERILKLQRHRISYHMAKCWLCFCLGILLMLTRCYPHESRL